jgi:uncharacterized YigZ family protein
MFVLKDQPTAEQLIKKSRFRAIAVAVDTEAAVKTALATHADPSANHNCFAWRIGTIYRMSDDGEPGGTAGKPIFQAMESRQLDRALVIVSRWFGGVLLGAGGLARAYGGTAAACLREAHLHETFETVTATVALAFSDLETVRSRLTASGSVSILLEEFDHEGCKLTVEFPERDAADLVLLIVNLTRGRSSLVFPAAPPFPNA